MTNYQLCQFGTKVLWIYINTMEMLLFLECVWWPSFKIILIGGGYNEIFDCAVAD